YSAPGLTAASLQMSCMVVRWKPARAKHNSAASRICSRRARWVSGLSFGIPRPPAERLLLALHKTKRTTVLFARKAAKSRKRLTDRAPTHHESVISVRLLHRVRAEVKALTVASRPAFS